MGGPRPQILSEADRQRFEARGLIRLDGVIPRRTVEAMAERLWRDLAERHGAAPAAPATWRLERLFGFQNLQASGAFDAMATAPLRGLLDEIMGPGGWSEPSHWGQPLVCFPTQAPWSVPHRHWHLDGPCEPAARRQMVGRLFLVLAPLEPQGGGTLVATGSHRLVEDIADQAGTTVNSGEMRRKLMTFDPWFCDLMSAPSDQPEDRNARFMATETEVAGIPMRVEEMTGEPGDLYLMHPRSLHAGAPNVRSHPRLVLSQFILARV